MKSGDRVIREKEEIGKKEEIKEDEDGEEEGEESQEEQ